MTQGWDASAQAWIEVIGSEGDWGRRHVLDAPMLQRARARVAWVAATQGAPVAHEC